MNWFRKAPPQAPRPVECIHVWGKWGNPTPTVIKYFSTYAMTGEPFQRDGLQQDRYCGLCNIVERRTV